VGEAILTGEGAFVGEAILTGEGAFVGAAILPRGGILASGAGLAPLNFGACGIVGLSRRRAAEQRGREAERAVVEYWLSLGFRVLARRQRTILGEIDMAVANETTLVFVEVKARADFGRAAETLPPWKQARLLNAAEYLLAVHADWRRETTRFDVALVCHGRIEVIEDAIRHH
jgi:putative endonuclease